MNNIEKRGAPATSCRRRLYVVHKYPTKMVIETVKYYGLNLFMMGDGEVGWIRAFSATAAAAGQEKNNIPSRVVC